MFRVLGSCFFWIEDFGVHVLFGWRVWGSRVLVLSISGLSFNPDILYSLIPY